MGIPIGGVKTEIPIKPTTEGIREGIRRALTQPRIACPPEWTWEDSAGRLRDVFAGQS